MYLWNLHKKKKNPLLSKNTHISENHINLEMKNNSYKCEKGLDCKSC